MPQIQYSEKYYDDVYEYRYAFILLRENVRSELGLHGRICPENAERWEDFLRFRLFSLSLVFALERWFENFKREGRVYVVFSSSLRHEKEGKNVKMRERSSNSSSPSSSASSLGCRGGWENIAFFLKFPSNHRSLSLFEIPINRHVVLPPDIAKCLPKNRLLNEVRFIELRFVVFSRSFFPTVVLSAEEEEEDVLFSSLLFPCVLKICVESDDERRRIEILTKTSFSLVSKTQNNRRNGED